jgi:hypothetical protein
VVDIAAAVAGINYLRDFTRWVRGLQKDADVLTRINAAEEKVGEVHDKLQELRAENLTLLEQNRELTAKLRAADDWKERRSHYKLVKTAGGAHVLHHAGNEHETPHHACPACAQRQLLFPLQDNGVANGSYTCPGCKHDYSVDAAEHRSRPPYSAY